MPHAISSQTLNRLAKPERVVTDLQINPPELTTGRNHSNVELKIVFENIGEIDFVVAPGLIPKPTSTVEVRGRVVLAPGEQHTRKVASNGERVLFLPTMTFKQSNLIHSASLPALCH